MFITEQKILDITQLNCDKKKSHLFDCIVQTIRPKIESIANRKTKQLNKIEELIEEKRQSLIKEKKLLEEYNSKILKKKEIVKRLKRLDNIITSKLIQENQKYETSVLIKSIENVSLDRVDKMISSFLI